MPPADPSPASGGPAAPASPVPAPPPGLVQHPLLVGLWQELPDPKAEKLSPEQQENWIETAKLVLKLLYSGDGGRLGVGLTYGQTPGSGAAEPGQN